MRNANFVRAQLEASLAHRFPKVFIPQPHVGRAVESVGIKSVDRLLRGGLPLGAITEIVGPECSGRTSLALSFVAQMTQAGKVCTWVDVSSNLHPESAAAVGVDLLRLLWVRCGIQSKLDTTRSSSTGFVVPETYFTPPLTKKGLHGRGGSPHPRTEAKCLAASVGGLSKPELIATGRAELQRRMSAESKSLIHARQSLTVKTARQTLFSEPWTAIEKALRVTDLLLQAGGFGAIVLDLASIEPEVALRVPLATWFRYQKAAERSQASILLLTQHACAKSSAGLVLCLEAGNPLHSEATVLAGIEYRVAVARERFNAITSKVVPLRKPPQRESSARWQGQTTWTGSR